MRRERSDFLKTSDVDLRVRNIVPGFTKEGDLAKDIHLSRPGFEGQLQDLQEERINICFDNVGGNWLALNRDVNEVEQLRDMMKEREALIEQLLTAPEGNQEQEEETLAEHHDEDDEAEEMDGSRSDKKGSGSEAAGSNQEQPIDPLLQADITYDYFLGNEGNDSQMGILERGLSCEYHN